MRGRVVPLADLGEDDLRAWQDLADHAAEPNPLFEPSCLVPAARHLPHGREIRLALAEEDGTFMACFPVVRTPARARPSTSWPGTWRPTLSTQVRRNRYDSTPLVRADRGEDALAALFSALAGLRGDDGAGILVLEAMDFDGPTSSWVLAAANRLRLPLHVAHAYERPVVRLRCGVDALSVHQPRTRQDWRRKERLLAKELGGPVELVDRSDDPAAVNELLDMEAAGYKGRSEGPRGPARGAEEARGGAFECWPGEPEWLAEMCDRFRADSRLRVYGLQVGTTTVAMQLLLGGGDGLFEILTAFDEAYARFSPGSLLAVKVIAQVQASSDVAWLDSCTYEDNVGMLRLLPDRRRVATVLVALGGMTDRAILAANVPAWKAADRVLGPRSPLRRNEHVRRMLARLATPAR